MQYYNIYKNNSVLFTYETKFHFSKQVFKMCSKVELVKKYHTTCVFRISYFLSLVHTSNFVGDFVFHMDANV
jgi:hypothetical protein